MPFLLLLVACCVLLASCSSGGQAPSVDTRSNILNPAPTDNSDNPFEGLDEGGAATDARGASVVYSRFFLDSVNHQSGGRWTVEDTSGGKSWTLSNTYQSAPKAWVIGGNYWNRENDSLTSQSFTIPADRPDAKLSFYSRHSVAAGDQAVVQISFNDGTEWSDVAVYNGTNNTSYPGWDKYLFLLPNAGVDRTCRLRVLFTSNTSGTDWGFGLDSVAVYQTQIDPPANLTATAAAGGVDLDWDHPAAGTRPETYTVERGTNVDGPFTVVGTADYPARVFFDGTAAAGTAYWYRVFATRGGYSSSPISAGIDGHSNWNAGSWTEITIAGATGGDFPTMAIVDGHPAVAFIDADGSISFIRSSTADGMNAADWSTEVTAESGAPLSYKYPVLIGVPGNPGIAYIEEVDDFSFFESEFVHYASSTDAQGAAGTWDVRASDVGENNELETLDGEVIDGKPAVGWAGYPEDSLFLPHARYRSATDALGTTWDSGGGGGSFGTGERVIAVGEVGGTLAAATAGVMDTDPDQEIYFSDVYRPGGAVNPGVLFEPWLTGELDIIESGGRAIVFYNAHDGSDVRAIRSIDQAVTGFESAVRLGFGGWNRFSAEIVGSLPALARLDRDGNMWYQRAKDTALTEWEPAQLVGTGVFFPDSENRRGKWMVEVDGEAAIVYLAAGNLIYARHTP